MVKTIKIGDVDVSFKTSAFLPILYRRETGQDFFKDVQESSEKTENLFNIAYIMHRHAEPEVKISIDDWLSQFNFIEFSNTLGTIAEMLTEEEKSTSEAKKKNVE